MRRRALAVGAVVLLALTCGACSSSGGSGGPSSGAPSSLSNTLPKTIESIPASGSDVPVQDFTKVSYVTPPGFVTAQGYSLAVPLEPANYQSYFLVPSNETQGLDVLSLTMYTSPTPINAATRADRFAQVKAFNTKLKAVVSGAMQEDLVAGLPAVRETAKQPPNYNYETWFLFGTGHFLQVTCQYDKQRTRIEDACQTLLHSVALK